MGARYSPYFILEPPGKWEEWLDKPLSENVHTNPLKSPWGATQAHILTTSTFLLISHCRNVKLSLSLPKTRCTYWSSQAKQRGMACSLEKAELSLSLNLTLVPVTSDLHQRHRSNWTISSLSGCGQGIRAHIKQSTEPLDVTEASALKASEGVRGGGGTVHDKLRCFCFRWRRRISSLWKTVKIM